MFLYSISLCLFGLMFEIIQAVPGDVESIALAGNKYAESESDVEVVCKIANFSTNIAVHVYKTDSKDISSAYTSLSPCTVNMCLTSVIDRYTFTADATSVRVLITNLRRADDQKYWTCASSTGSKMTLYLEVFTTPKSVYLASLRNQTSYDLSFENMSVECFTTCAYPAPTFEWYSLEPGKLSVPVNKSAVTASSHRNCGDAGSMTYRSTMYLREYTTSENNTDITVAVECRVSFPTMEKPLVSKPSIFIRYAVAVTQVQMVDNNNVLNGSDVIVSQRVAYSVRCIPNESRPNPTFIWYLALVEIHRSLNSSYTFVPAEEDHGKALNCKAFNIQPEKDAVSSIISRLYVKVPPEVQITISKEKANEYDEVQIRCNATGRPENIRFESIQHVYGDVFIPMPLSSVSNTVYIPAVGLQDIGTYICSASNGVLDDDENYFQSARKNLTISGLPKIFASDLNRYASLKEAVEIKVHFFTYTSYHTSKIIRQDGKVMVGGRFKIAVSQTPITTVFYGKLVTINGFQISFSIDGISIEDFSQYTVLVTNEIGTVSQEFHILPKEIPTHPTNFSFVGFKQHSPVFRWIGGFNGGAPQRFIIEISEADKAEWKEILATEESSNTDKETHAYVEESRIERLSPGVYKARIWSVNEIGESKFDQNNYIEFEVKADGMSTVTTSTAAIVGGCLGTVIVILVVVLLFTGRNVYSGICKKGMSDKSPPQLPTSSTEGERSIYNTLQEETEIRTYETMGKPDLETYENTKVSSL